MTVLLLAAFATAIALRPDALPLDPQAATRMTPAALGDAVLAPGHPPVVDATVGRQGMGPPPPPGPYATTLRLYLAPRPGHARDFCEQTVATVRLQPAAQSVDGHVAPSPPATIALSKAYLWIGPTAASSACGTGRRYLLQPPPDSVTWAFDEIRKLARLQEDVRRRGPLPPTTTLDDRIGDGEAIGTDLVVDPRRALAALPLREVAWVGPSATASGNLLREGDLGSDGMRQATTFFIGGVWTVTIAYQGQRIAVIRMRRAVPPPF